MSHKYCEYKSELIAAGFSEATKRQGNFFIRLTELTAFVVDMKEMDDGIQIVYGAASTAFTRFRGAENALIEWGVATDDCNIRRCIDIWSEADEEEAKQRILDLYQKYRFVSKDELLLIAKDARKVFLQQITDVLKPLGFKKKGNAWRTVIGERYMLIFDAQKSLYADKYYFNITVKLIDDKTFGECFGTRVVEGRSGLFDWQLMPGEQLQRIMGQAVEKYLLPIMNTPLSELGKKEWIWRSCICKRNKCEHCWVEKNLWEAKERTGRY